MNRREVLQGMAAASVTLRMERVAFGQDAPVATTAAGKVSGRVENGINVFRGIPYGEDTRKTRFKAPMPVAAWSGVKECVEWSTRTPQLTVDRGAGGERVGFHLPPDKGEQSEDCLHVNVWTPGLRDGKKRAVLFYIHGGAYNNGTANCDLYDGNRLCHRGDVVVVTVNHRLNAFGYMYLGELGGKEYADSGNAGMLDLVLALKWVQKNIAEFGGDASRVLIFGQSGGGAKCATLMAMPAAKGLFHRVLTMSGQQVTAKPTVIANEVAKDVLDKLGVKYGDLDALKTLPMEKIQEAARVSSAWLPVMDGGVLPRDPFDPDAPGLSAGVPMILANTHDETVTSAAGRTGVLTWEQAPEALKNSVGQYLGSYTPEEMIGGIGRSIRIEMRRILSWRLLWRFVRGLGRSLRRSDVRRMRGARRIRGSTGWIGRCLFRDTGRSIRSIFRLCLITSRWLRGCVGRVRWSRLRRSRWLRECRRC